MSIRLSVAAMSERGLLLWFLHTTDSFTQRNVFELMVAEGKEVPLTEKIVHSGKQVTGYHVTHSAYLWLSKNRSDIPTFRLFHSEYKEGPWVELASSTNSLQRLRSSSEAKGARRLKAKKPVEKGALMHRSRSLHKQPGVEEKLEEQRLRGSGVK
jgi:hypothetical protein